MPGMYPEDQIVNIFGTEVCWPNMDPETGKFTNGDFGDPLKKPSFIPAETVNLILDNLQNFIKGLGLNPNNTDPNQLLQALQNKYIKREDAENLVYPAVVFTYNTPTAIPRLKPVCRVIGKTGL